MTWIVLAAAVLVLFVALIISQRRSPRDLLHADPNLSSGYRVIRWVGNGLVFFAVIHLVHWVWLGVKYSLWTKGGMTLIALALFGVAAVFVTSAKRGAATREVLRTDPIRTWGYRATRWVGNGLVFFAAIQVMAWLWSGAMYSLWTRNGMAMIALGLTGVVLVFATSAKLGAQPAK